MEHVVFSAAQDGAGEEFRRVASLEEAVRVVEHLRNDLGITDPSVFALTPVPVAFRTYYRVEVPGFEEAAGAGAGRASSCRRRSFQLAASTGRPSSSCRTSRTLERGPGVATATSSSTATPTWTCRASCPRPRTLDPGQPRRTTTRTTRWGTSPADADALQAPTGSRSGCLDCDAVTRRTTTLLVTSLLIIVLADDRPHAAGALRGAAAGADDEHARQVRRQPADHDLRAGQDLSGERAAAADDRVRAADADAVLGGGLLAVVAQRGGARGAHQSRPGRARSSRTSRARPTWSPRRRTRPRRRCTT